MEWLENLLGLLTKSGSSESYPYNVGDSVQGRSGLLGADSGSNIDSLQTGWTESDAAAERQRRKAEIDKRMAHHFGKTGETPASMARASEVAQQSPGFGQANLINPVYANPMLAQQLTQPAIERQPRNLLGTSPQSRYLKSLLGV